MKIRLEKRAKSRRKIKLSPRVIALISAIVLFSFIYIVSLPDVREFKTTNPQTTALISSRGTRSLGASIRWTRLSDVSPQLQRAVIIAEDANFYGHNGVDFNEVWNALYDSLVELELPRGASTITQQLAKNLYLSESYNPLRKVKEFLIAKHLEKHLGKKRILEIYLNVIEWGDGVYGIAHASRHYFGVEPSSLNAEQSAFLAAIIPNPLSTYNPTKHPRRVERRKSLILRRMQKN